MRVIVATTVLPFERGGAEYMTDSLCDALGRKGHEVERFELPFSSHYPSMLEEMMALRLLDLSGAGDRLIAIRTPSYLLKHPHKAVWFIHHHRASFDLWGTSYQDVPNGPLGNGYREAFRSADNVALREAEAVFANSNRMRERVSRFNAIQPEILYPPLRIEHGLSCKSYSNYIFCPGRIVDHKRQHLCVEAMEYVTSPVRLLVAGPASPEYLETITSGGLADRVTLQPGWLPEDEKASLLANALAVAYVPIDEDSYGYVSLEAAQSRKAVVTCTDSGGLLEFVKDGENGFVAEPTPPDLARCFDALWDRKVAARMGEAACERIATMKIGWDTTIERLLFENHRS